MAKHSTSLAPAEQALRASVRRHLTAGLAIGALLLGGAGGWAATTEFAGAVITSGQFVVDSAVKKVQHPTGGVVGELRVHDGDHVRAGDILLRLDETVTRANLAIVSKGLDELSVRLARLAAERDGKATMSLPYDLAARARSDDIASLINGEASLLRLRAEAREGQKAQLRERIAQLRQEVDGLQGQIRAKGREIELIQSELVGVRDLFDKNLVPIQRVTLLERDAARLEGERGQIVAAVAQARGKISEIELQIIQVDQDLRSEVAKDLREAEAKQAELVERKVAAQDQLKRVDLRAPQDGVVHQLAAHTIGGVISPGEPVMLIVPQNDRLVVEAKLPPQEIDHVRVGQNAMLRLSAFDQRVTPEIAGEVTIVSPDTTADQKSGQSFYTIRIAVAPDAAARLGSVKLVPGMPVEAFIQTPPRTVLTYLTKPLADQVERAFREH